MSNKAQGRYVSSLTRDTLGVILAGGRGSRLKQLTLNRAKPATPFGGKYRIIDFPLSNCVNSGIRRIAVMTQYKAHDLIIHLQRAWGHFRGEFGEHVVDDGRRRGGFLARVLGRNPVICGGRHLDRRVVGGVVHGDAPTSQGNARTVS